MQQEQAWTQIAPNVARRPLVGIEKVLNYTEYYQNGNFQLSAAMKFETSMPPETLRRRFGLAVWNTRKILPELGLWSVGTTKDSSLDLDHIMFEAIQNVQDAQKWIDETAVVVQDGTTVQEVVDFASNHRIEPAGKQFRVTLVSSPREGDPAIVMNVSHVVNGHRLLEQACEIIQALVDDRLSALVEAHPDPSAALEAVFVPEDLSLLLPKLPISLNTAYNQTFQPQEEQLEAGLEKFVQRLANGAQPSIGIPRFQTPASVPEVSLGTANGRPMTMLNLRRRLPAAENVALQQTLKQHGCSLPAFVYACIVNSIDRLCRSSTSEEEASPGVHLPYSAHARRWFPKETFMAQSPVNMAIVIGSAYLLPDELRSQQRGSDLNQDELFALAKTIRTKQNEFLNSPHMISVMENFGTEFCGLMAKTAAKHCEAGTDPLVALSENAPAFCPPTLTSQGEFPIKRFYTRQGASSDPTPDQPEGDYIYITDGVIGGRTTDASVCFAMWSGKGILTLQAHFDSHFFDAKLIDTILDHVFLQLRRTVSGADASESEANLWVCR